MPTDVIDLRTVFLLTTCIAATTAMLMVVLWRSHPNESAVPSWTVGSVLVAAGFLAIALRGSLPLAVSISLANACISVGHACFLSGVNQITERKPLAWPAMAALGAAIATSFAYFTYVQSSTATRMAIQFVVLGLLALTTAHHLWCSNDAVKRLPHRAAAGVFAAFGLTLLLRVGLMFFDTPEQDLFAHSPVHDAVFVIMLLFYAALMYCFPALLFAKDIATRMIIEAALRNSDEAYHTILSTSLDGFWLISPQGRLLDVNERYLQQSGYSRDELLGMHIPDLEAREDPDETAKHVRRVIAEGSDQFETMHRRKDGSIWHVEVSTIYHRSSGRFFAFLRDISARKQAESALRIAASAFESQEGMVVTDNANVILQVNYSFTKITGYTAGESIGRTLKFLRSGRHDATFYATMWDTIKREGSWQGEIWNRNKNGEVHPHWLTISAVKDDNNVVTHYVGAYTDITERKIAEDEIRNLAFYDPLTRLPNRRLMLDRLEQALIRSTRHNRRGALMLIDLDRFKTINDTLGHEAGDQLLIEVAQRLSCTVRQSDLVARLGGDEFVIVLTEADSPADVAHVAGKIVAAVSAPYLIAGQELSTSPSIGICIYPDDAGESQNLIKQADVAMYAAKARGRGNYQFFTEEMHITAIRRLALEADLRASLAQHQFVLHYQPQLDLRNGRVVGVEALLRWQHPGQGLVSPTEFIPIAEETGLIVPLGDWVLQEACRQMAAWRAGGLDLIRVSVNLSAVQFTDRNLPQRIREIRERVGLPPGSLDLEVTESMTMQSPEETIAIMHVLTGQGETLSIDDFGTGYSSLAYLKLFPIRTLKIDRSFVKDIETDSNDADICGVTVSLAHKLGLEVVAEGVETEAQLQYLRSVGCEMIQGYLISKPLPADEVGHFLRARILAGGMATTETGTF